MDVWNGLMKHLVQYVALQKKVDHADNEVAPKDQVLALFGQTSREKAVS